jgi:hypothetical protein
VPAATPRKRGASPARPLGGQVPRDPHESALWQFATKSQYYGISSKMPPEQVARMNWEISQARAKLAAYNKQYGDAGEARLATEDKAAFNLTLNCGGLGPAVGYCSGRATANADLWPGVLAVQPIGRPAPRSWHQRRRRPTSCCMAAPRTKSGRVLSGADRSGCPPGPCAVSGRGVLEEPVFAHRTQNLPIEFLGAHLYTRVARRSHRLGPQPNLNRVQSSQRAGMLRTLAMKYFSVKRLISMLAAGLIAASLVATPIAAQESSDDTAEPDDSVPAPVVEDATPASPAACTTGWNPRTMPGPGPLIFAHLKGFLSRTVDVGYPCGPAYQGCEGYCMYRQDFADGLVIVETTTTGWVFFRKMGDAEGFTDGKNQWLDVDNYRPPLVLGPPYWFCRQPGLLEKLGLQGCG